MTDWLLNNWLSVVIIIAIVFVVMLLLKFKRYDMIKKIVLSLVVKAEKELGSGTGELKYVTVVEGIYALLPRWLSFLLSKKEIDNLIESSVAKLKELLSDGVDLTSYDDERYIEQFEASEEK